MDLDLIVLKDQAYLDSISKHLRPLEFYKIRAQSINLVLSNEEMYNGVVVISFCFDKPVETDLYIDFQGTSITRILINELPIKNDENLAFRNHQIKIGKTLLVQYAPQEEIRVRIEFCNQFNTQVVDQSKNEDFQLGIFQRVEDQSTYIFTSVQPMYTRKIFPCFDQVDMRGNFKLSLDTPVDWICGSNQPVLKEEVNTEKQRKRTFFGQTAPLSTYLYAFFAGNYQYVQAGQEFTVPSLVKPMRIYFRKQFYSQLENQAGKIFKIIQQGMEFLEEYFQVPYPFQKYDQVFCPFYPGVANEHPGCVHFSEAYIISKELEGNPENWQYRIAVFNRAEIFFHELSHMWCGNITSIEWWNDCWIKQGLATFLQLKFFQSNQHFLENFNYILPKLEQQLFLALMISSEKALSHQPPLNTSDYLGQDEKGRDTYQRGASVFLHLETQIGNELVKEYLRKIIKKYYFNPVSAFTLQEQLILFLEISNKQVSRPFQINGKQFFEQFVFNSGLTQIELLNNDQQMSQGSDVLIIQQVSVPQQQSFQFFKDHYLQAILTSPKSWEPQQNKFMRNFFEICSQNDAFTLKEVIEQKSHLQKTWRSGYIDIQFTDDQDGKRNSTRVFITDQEFNQIKFDFKLKNCKLQNNLYNLFH